MLGFLRDILFAVPAAIVALATGGNTSANKTTTASNTTEYKKYTILDAAIAADTEVFYRELLPLMGNDAVMAVVADADSVEEPSIGMGFLTRDLGRKSTMTEIRTAQWHHYQTPTLKPRLPTAVKLTECGAWVIEDPPEQKRAQDRRWQICDAAVLFEEAKLSRRISAFSAGRLHPNIVPVLGVIGKGAMAMFRAWYGSVYDNCGRARLPPGHPACASIMRDLMVGVMRLHEDLGMFHTLINVGYIPCDFERDYQEKSQWLPAKTSADMFAVAVTFLAVADVGGCHARYLLDLRCTDGGGGEIP
ncbi:hypothetical protein BC828DRAFT_402113 [Blastocladiella britannica]|nr:hypothetical protein BC828DRAFT_402113 [Blastocladiella britannica]